MKEIVELTQKDERYPKLLSQIHDTPKTLYCRGNLDLLESDCFAVVGTRKLTSYGKETTNNIVGGLVGAGFTIVSGLAMGIDAVAHQAALDWGGKTIAVLGTGIKNIYPPSNINLANEILNSNGLIISEYAENEPGYKSNFPERNRIISGLSRGVLVVEADEISGSLITAKCALDQNRDVFAIPGSIFSTRSIGPNKLIRQGAKLVTSVQDILDEYSANLELFGPPVGSKRTPLSTKDPVQINILAILDKNGAMHIDDVVRESQNETSKIIAALSVLEIKGIVKNLGNGKYRIS